MSSDPDSTCFGSEPSRRAGYAFAIVSSIAAGLATVVGKWNLESISPLLMNSLIFSVATVTLTITWLPFRGAKSLHRLTFKGWLWLSLFTASSWLAIWLFWAGVKRMDPSLAAFLNRTEVPIAVFLGIILLKERFTRLESLGAVLSIVGIVIMRLTLRFEYSSGFWLVLSGAVFFGLTEYICKIAVKHVEPVTLAYIRNALMAFAYWLVFFATDSSFEGLASVWPGVLALGIIGPILSRMAYLMALKRLELSKVAVVSQSQPVFVILIALLALNQLPTLREVTGGLFLIAGCIFMVVSRRSQMNYSKY